MGVCAEVSRPGRCARVMYVSTAAAPVLSTADIQFTHEEQFRDNIKAHAHVYIAGMRPLQLRTRLSLVAQDVMRNI